MKYAGIAVVTRSFKRDNGKSLQFSFLIECRLMSMSSTTRPAVIKRRAENSGMLPDHSSQSRPQVFDVLPPDRTWWQQIVEQFNGNEGAGYAISFVVHLLILMLLAIPVIRSYQSEEGFTTLVENATDEQVIFDAPLDTIVATPESASSEENFETKLFDPTSNQQEFIPQLQVDLQTSVKGDGDGSGTDGDFGGGRVAEPDNAVKAGNFSVWPWPILAGKVNGEIRHGTPGEAPQVRQSYSIVIRIKVPSERKFVRLYDFSGTVVGTDGYTQKIPEDAYYFRSSGELIKARPNHRLPVIDGTAEILIRVPGASFAEVKDTIVVYSRILDEEQEIDLVFQSRD